MEARPIAVMFTDLHIGADNADMCKDVAFQAVDLASSLGVKCVINGGDTFNSRKSQSLSSLKVVTKILDYCLDRGIEMIAIDGNHDKLMYKDADSYMDVYATHPAMRLIKTFNTIFIDNVDVSFASFYSDDNQCTSNSLYVSMIKELTSRAHGDILVTHHGINGAKSNSGVAIESDITSKLFSAFKTVLVGHYHDPSSIGKNIHYVGSCRQAWYNENTDKGFVILYSDASFKRVPSSFMKYVEIDVVLIDEYNKRISDAMASLSVEHPLAMKRLHLIGDRVAIRSIDVMSIKSKGFDVRTTDNTKNVISDEGVNYVIFDNNKMAGLFVEFLDEEGIVDDNDVEYGMGVLGRTLSDIDG